MRSPSTDALRQIVDDYSGRGIGSVLNRSIVEQACTIAAGPDGEGFAVLVFRFLALSVTLFDRFDATSALECSLFDLGRDGAADTLDRALSRLTFEDRRGDDEGYKCGECGELHVGLG